MLDSVIKVNKKVLPLIHFWKNGNMKKKKTKIETFITDDLDPS